MIRGTATLAILGTRLRRELGFTLFAIAAAILLAALQRRDSFATEFAGCVLYGTLAAIAGALRQRSGRLREIELCEQSAPLFGRELARARALVPCAIVTLIVTAYWATIAVRSQVEVLPALLALGAANAAAVLALSATLREGKLRGAYVALAAATGTCALLAGGFHDSPLLLAIVAIYVLAGVVALRQYGEALARYDPVEGF